MSSGGEKPAESPLASLRKAVSQSPTNNVQGQELNMSDSHQRYKDSASASLCAPDNLLQDAPKATVEDKEKNLQSSVKGRTLGATGGGDKWSRSMTSQSTAEEGDKWIAPSTSAQSENKTVELGKTPWKTFSIKICSFDGNEVVCYSKIDNRVHQTCIQFYLEEVRGGMDFFPEATDMFELQLSEEWLILKAKEEKDNDPLEDAGSSFKRKLLKTVEESIKCESVMIMKKDKKTVFEKLKRYEPLLNKNAVLYKMQDEIFLVTGHKEIVEQVVKFIKSGENAEYQKDVHASGIDETKPKEQNIPDKTVQQNTADEISKRGLVDESEEKVVKEELPISPDQADLILKCFKYDGVNIGVNTERKVIEIYGKKKKVLEVRTDISKKMHLVVKDVIRIGKLESGFYRLPNVKSYIDQALKANEICCVWSIDEETLSVQSLSKKTAIEGQKLIKECVCSEVVPSSTVSKPNALNLFLQKYKKQKQAIVEKFDNSNSIVVFTNNLCEKFRACKKAAEQPTKNVYENEHTVQTSSETPMEIDEGVVTVRNPNYRSQPSNEQGQMHSNANHNETEMEIVEEMVLTDEVFEYIERFEKDNMQQRLNSITFWMGKVKGNRNIISLQGKTSAVQKARTAIEKFCQNLHQENTHCFTDMPWQSFEKKRKQFELEGEQCLIKIQKSQEIMVRHAWLFTKGSLSVVTVNTGPIEFAEADILVCPVTNTLYPIGIGEDIFFKGGPEEIQIECIAQVEAKTNSTFKSFDVGEVIPLLRTGSLNCQRLGLCVLPQSKCSKDVLEKVVQKIASDIVSMTMDTGLRIIAFPVHSIASNEGMEVSRLLLLHLMNMREHFDYTLQIHFYCDTEEDADCFNKMLNERLPITNEIFHVDFDIDQKDLGTAVNDVPNIEVEVQIGSIVDMHNKVDVLVNSTNYFLDLKRGMVSQLLLERAGESIQSELNTKYQDGVAFGDVAVTRPGRLQCKMICHGVLSSFINDGDISTQILKLMMTRCLLAAEKEGYDSLAFPALGAGNLQYPSCVVARSMLEAVDDFTENYKPVHVQKVVLVLYKGDTELIQTFKDIQSSRSKRKTQKKKDTLFGFPPDNLMRTHLKTGIHWMVTDKNIYQQLAKKEARVVLNPSKARELSYKWDAEEDIFDLVINTDGTEDSVKTCFEHVVKIISEKKHQTVDIFLFSHEIGSPVTGVRKQMLILGKVLVANHQKIMKTSVGQKQKKMDYIRLVRLFVNPSDYSDIKGEVMKTQKPAEKGKDKNKEFSAWHLMEVTRQSVSRYTIQVFGSKDITENVARKMKQEMQKHYQETLHTGQWYYVNKAGTQELPFEPQSNTKLNKAASTRCDKVDIQMKDTLFDVDIENMEMKDKHGFKMFGLRYDDKKRHGDAEHTSVGSNIPDKKSQASHGISSGYAAAASKSPQLVPGRAVKQDVLEEKIKENVQSKKTELDVYDMVSGEIEPSFIGRAKQNQKEIEKLGVSFIYNEKTSSILINGTLESIRKTAAFFGSEGAVIQVKKKDQNASFKRTLSHKDTEKSFPMSEDDYVALVHFSKDEEWWRQIIFQEYKDGKLIFSSPTDPRHNVKKIIKDKLQAFSTRTDIDVILKQTLTAEELHTLEREMPEEVDIYLSYDKQRLKIKSSNYEKAQQSKFKLEVKLGIIKPTGGGRRHRQFASNDDSTFTSGDTKKKTDFSSSMRQPKTSSNNFGLGSAFEDKKKFKTKEGLKVMVYKGDILNLNVDCIVNAANEDMAHGGGVAFFIAQAAGYPMQQECDAYIQRHGSIPVGECCSTTAGNLNYRCVIHTVGPRWDSYRDKYVCLEDLKKSVISALEEADYKNLSSIAIPSISSGIFRVPKELCAQQYYRAVEEYSKQQFASGTLKEVHFVDKSADMCKTVLEEFEKCFGGDQASAGNSHRNYRRSNSESGTLSSPETEKDIWDSSKTGDRKELTVTSYKPKTNRQKRILTNQFIFDLSDKVQVHLVKGDIVSSKADAIVCPQDEYLSCAGRIAKAIHSKANEVYNDVNARNLKNQKHDICAVYPLKTAVAVNWNYIFHVVPPRWGLLAVQHNQKFEALLKKTATNILEKTEEYSKISSIAIPLMGISTDEIKYPTPIPTCAKNILLGIKEYSAGAAKSLKVEMYTNDDAVLGTLREVFSGNTSSEKGLSTSTYQKEKFEDNKNLQKTVKDTPAGHNFGTTMKGPLEQTDSCCICMDDMENPKKLNCGHMFCKGCIDEAFKHKPACPSCGTVYGIVKGNQPTNGTIRRTEHQYPSLAGYVGYGHIKITYSFPDGVQGSEHPEEGTRYKGITRSAYLPDNMKGRLVADLLELAFKQRLVFTIGDSRTTGEKGVITWNDVHHKTRMEGGPQRFGYPDETYLDRVLGELEDKGITKEALRNS